ncbi:glycosyltransferase family 4 protein [Flavobacteriaceae bacterium S356]|uniref:Glycosyltransferase family 4 protein n=1 Tax=Asprobacillus argus TaxID=3076534 RepID=A0ABU3LHJ8_9FLAO|nr:glycosyltransferase family 4 protein [Flavobacteriaceae bacterium S356]
MFKEQLIFNLLYKWKYLFAILRAKFLKKDEISDVSSITYVAREADKDWIFGAKVRRLATFSGLDAAPYFHDRLRDLPDSDGYFFVFHQYFYRAMRHNPQILNKKNIVMFTHPHWSFSFSKTHVIWCLNKADKVICLNSNVQKELIAAGLQADKTELIHIASNPDFFYPHDRKTGSVGFCSAFGDRKNPEMVFNLVKHMPDRHFYMIGRYWDQYEKYEELIALPNFTYFDNEEYEKYPDLYNKIDIFISPSTLEGGPVPVLEAMLSNCFPIASKTGFCPDIIDHGKNGFLFDIDASYKEVMTLIDEADTKDIDVRATALPYSWENCSKKLDTLFSA